MLKNLTDKSARNQCEMNATESKRRLDFLDGELRKLYVRKQSFTQQTPTSEGSVRTFGSRHSSLEDVMHSSAGGPTSPAGHRGLQSQGSGFFGNIIGRGSQPGSGVTSPNRSSSANSLDYAQPSGTTAFDNMKYGTALTSDKIKYRLKQVRHKLDVEQKVKTGTENMVKAIADAPAASQDPSVMTELLEKIAEANAKLAFLQKSEHKYAGLNVEDEEEEENYLADVRLRKTGRLKLKLLGATNLPGRRNSKEELKALIRVDGVIKHETKYTRNQWNEYIDLQVDKAQEVEIAVYDRNLTLLGLVWYRLWELDEDITAKYGQEHDRADVEETWLDMEPAGQLLLKMNFVPLGRTKTARDQVFRRNPVQKVFPKNGHRFLPQSFYHVMQCALCHEFLGRQGYQCQNCSYTVHAKCYSRVITKCITKEEIRGEPTRDNNSGQLLKYNIPHRWETTTNLGAAWCTHCGYILPPGRKMHRCSECQQTSHRECSPCVPNFCGLAPEMADMLVAAFEEHERKLHQREMEEAERARRATLEDSTHAQLQRPPSQAVTPGSLPSSMIAPPRGDSIAGTEAIISAYQQMPPQAKPLPTPPSQSAHSATPYDALAQLRIGETLPSTTVEIKQSPKIQQYPDNQQSRPSSSVAPVSPQQQHQQQQPPSQQYYQQPYAHPYGQPQQQPYYTQQPPQPRISVPAIAAPRPPVSENVPPPSHQHLPPGSHQHISPQPQIAPQQQQQLPPHYYHGQTPPAAVTQQHRPMMNLPPTNITLNDFDFIAVLGRGAFGKVMMAAEKQTQQLYAVKALKKEFIIQNDDVKSTKLEKRIFQAASAAHHPFLVNLHSCFQTDNRVYFVMEYVSGGDLMAHIQDKKRFSQARAKFYACEVLLALEYFHKNNIIYRDLKLDNILMCPDGHIKVADYGICKENMPYGQTTRTFCGTPDYMAPEILSSNRYGRSVDWWSFGVLIYVMLVGRYPFHGEDEQDVLDAILNDAVEYPSNIPRDTLSLLQGLMNKNPARRLGGGRLDAEEIKRHPYFLGVDWQAFMDKRVPPPWVPIIKNATDVSNFDPEFTREKAVLTPINSVLTSADQNEFADFNYVSEWAIQDRAAGARHGAN